MRSKSNRRSCFVLVATSCSMYTEFFVRQFADDSGQKEVFMLNRFSLH